TGGSDGGDMACNNGTEMAGMPCTPGTAIVTPVNTCGCSGGNGADSMSYSLYCDNYPGQFSCFSALNCTPAACTQCLETKCAQYMTDSSCQSTLDKAIQWIEKCAPDRAQIYSQTWAGACPSVQNLASCKNAMCYQGDLGGPCSLF